MAASLFRADRGKETLRIMEIAAIVTLAGTGIGVIAGAVQVIEYLEKKKRGVPPPPVPLLDSVPALPLLIPTAPSVSPLPQGTVTFLFTGIEGSTRLWQEHPEQMRLALARHDQLLRAAVEQHHGCIVKTTSDGVCAVFAAASDAVAAVLAAQCSLQAEPWGLETPLRVRMGLDTGVAEERDGDYYGSAVNRTARLMSAGCGGQVLISAATHELVRDHLPKGAELRDLGSARLRDLARAEQVHQLVHPDLLADFPPLRSLETLPNNLPPQVSSFVGREQQLVEVKELLGRMRFLTLVGIGGTGKTRLSLEAAADLLTGDGDGVWLVELAPLTDPALVPQAIAGVLGVKEKPGTPLLETLLQYLKPKCLLLILDNCEHLTDAAATLASEILRVCPQVSLLASSREPLGVSGEQVYRVPSLSLPDAQARTAESLSRCESAALFTARARSVQPAFAVTDTNAPAVAAICRRLDGIPLALELAAARVSALSVGEISARLDDRFRLLTGGSRTALPRQRTLQALVDWSYDLLTDAEKTALCRLSVFYGGWTLDAAEAVCAGGEVRSADVLDLLTGLVNKSLVVAEADAGGMRYRLLETVRQYARDRLVECGEAETVQDRTASWFLALAEEAQPQLTGAEQGAWLSRLETEHDNLRAGLSWLEQSAAGGGAELRLAGALWRFWHVRGHMTEGRQWLGRALAQTAPEAVGLDGAVGQEGAGQEGAGQEGAAARATALNGAGNLAREQGDYAGARALHEESLAMRRQLGDQLGVAASLNNLGGLARERGDYAGAWALQEESLAICRQLGHQQGVAASLNNLGNVARERGDYAGARALQEESLAICRQLGDQQGVAACLDEMTAVADGQSLPSQAARLGGAAASLRESLDAPLSPAEQAEVDKTIAAVREALGEDAFAAAWDAGRAMTWEQAVEFAMGETRPA